MLCACIDIGSNTTRLLVARSDEGRLREVLQQRVFTRMGSTPQIAPEKLDLVAAAVAQQVRLARESGAAHLRAVGTHAIRQAVNRDELLERIEREAGIGVDVLTGDEEARYAFLGATQTLADAPPGEIGVVDVGGGSTEIVCGTLAGGVSWSASFRVGSGFLADSYLHSDPPTPGELEQVRRHVAETLAGLDAPQPAAAYAVGGSATSLRRLVGGVLDPETVRRGIDVLAAHPAAELAQRLDLHAERVRLLPAGMILLEAAAAVLGAPLQIARGGLREGVLLEALRVGGA